MGGIISIITNLVSSITQGFQILVAVNTQHNALLQRIASTPGLPVENPTKPYWLDDAPFPELNEIVPNIPREADVIIIGSGITGAAAAKSILELKGPDTKVLVLEAREISSGATGRNGGHIKTPVYQDFAHYSKTLGSEELARDVVRFELKHLPTLREFEDKFPLAEIREAETVDFFFHQKEFDDAKRELGKLNKWLPEVDIKVWDAKDAVEKFHANELIAGAISYPSGAIWPFRFVTSLWKELKGQYTNLTLMAFTPVETSRGIVHGRHILHATNGYAGHLLPQLRSSLTGVRAAMSAQKPGSDFPTTGGARSWGMIYNPGFDYVTQRPDGADGSPGDCMVGGGFTRSKEQGLDNVGIWDDSTMDALTMVHIEGIMSTTFGPNWGLGGGLKKRWTGILGVTGDGLPFVGPMQDSISNNCKTGKEAGEWIAAGFNGRGMVWAWLSGTAVGIMIAGKDHVNLDKGLGRPAGKLDDWFPRAAVALDDKRLKNADLMNLTAEYF